MNRLALAICLSLAFSPLALAQAKKEPSAKQKAQQERMKDCNQQAGEQKLEGDARKGFMSNCLKGGAASKQSAQQNKMKDCNQQAGAKQLKGDERKKFMSSCLKG
ncbi:MAG: PsiF family protein [Betaproteobacteria bacterium]|nr:PsiF family protein [Betaproteobacteria bacterium]